MNDVGGKFFIGNIIALYIEPKSLHLKSAAISELDIKVKLDALISHVDHPLKDRNLLFALLSMPTQWLCVNLIVNTVKRRLVFSKSRVRKHCVLQNLSEVYGREQHLRPRPEK